MTEYTWGAQCICRKDDGEAYHRLARCMPDAYDSPEWEAFAKKATIALNNHDALVEALERCAKFIRTKVPLDSLTEEAQMECWELADLAPKVLAKAKE